MADKVIKVDEAVFERLSNEIIILNELAGQEFKELYRKSSEFERRKMRKPTKVTLKLYAETAVQYFLRNHIDPRTLGQEQDVLTEVRKLRNTIFAFMQVQQRTYLVPFSEDVFKLKNQVDSIEDVTYDMVNLMEIFIDMLLAGLGLSEQEQNDLRTKAADMFQRKKGLRKSATE
ncbi:hypothetical protein [Larkinella harenae]